MNLFNAKLNRAALIDALNLFKTTGCHIIQSRTEIPVLQCVRLVADIDRVTVTGTDLDCTLEIELPAFTQGRGTVILNCDTLRDAVKGMDGEHLDIADTGGKRARVYGDMGSTLIPVHTVDDWPVELGLWSTSFETREFVSKAFVHDLARIRASISTEQTRYYLNGAFFHVGDGKLRIAATDGHRLSVIERGVPEGFEDQPDVIVPRQAIQWVMRNAVKLGEQVRIGWTASQFIVKVGRVRFCTKVIDGTFPDISRVIPSQSNNPISFNADSVAKGAKSATAHCTGRTKSIAFSVGEGFHTLVGNDVETGRGHAFVAGTEYSGDDYVTGFNAGYLSELMASFKGQRVTMHQQDSDCPARFTSDQAPELTTVLMPLRLGSVAVYSPEELAKADRDAIQTFEAEAPKVIEAIAVCEEHGLPCDGKRAELGKLTGAAIDLYAARQGVSRYEARGVILTQLAAMGHGTAPAARVAERANAAAVMQSKQLLNSALTNHFQNGNSCPDDKPADNSHTVADAVVQPDEQEVWAHIPVSNPRYRSLQDFKAAAGIGSRWRLEGFNGTEWSGARERTVATVRARDLGFVSGDATQEQIDAVSNVRGFDGRSWISFPKQGDWYSTADALVLCYDNGQPKLRLTPMSIDKRQSIDDPIAALTAQVAALAETVAATGANDARVETAQPDQSAEIARLKAENASLAKQVVEARAGERQAQEALTDMEAEFHDTRATATRALLANTALAERADTAERELAEVNGELLRTATRDKNGPVIEREERRADAPLPPLSLVPEPNIGDADQYCATA